MYNMVVQDGKESIAVVSHIYEIVWLQCETFHCVFCTDSHLVARRGKLVV